MISSIVNKVYSLAYSRLSDWSTDRKIVVIESDDWGSIRMSSRTSYESFRKIGIPVEDCVFNRNDSLEGNDDLSALFEVLNSVKDAHGNPAVMTANTVVANPDFEKIRKSGYSTYAFETFDRTLSRYPRHDHVFELYRQGLNNRIFFPQFHCREHVHVPNWINDLQKENSPSRLAFANDMFSLTKGSISSCNAEFLDAHGIYNNREADFVLSGIAEGLAIFEKLFGYKSKSVISPCYIWDNLVEKILADNGVLYIQSGRGQLLPRKNSSKSPYKVKYRFMGEQNEYNQIYLMRNVYFEPSTNFSLQPVETTLRRIARCFKQNRPAVICTHRVNYIGQIHEENRKSGLASLGHLLSGIKSKWPNVEFLTSAELGSIITQEMKNN